MKLRLFITCLTTIQILTVIISGFILFSYNYKNQLLKKEINYIDKLIVTDTEKLRIFKTKYAWLSSPEIVAHLTQTYLDEEKNNIYGFDIRKTYSMKRFETKVKPKLYSKLDADLY